MRSHLVLEVASELVDRDDWPYRQVQIKLKEQVARAWPVTLFGSDTAGVIEQVAHGEVQGQMRHIAAEHANLVKRHFESLQLS